MTPEQRRLRAHLAANARWSRPMAREDQAGAARAAMHERLGRQVDPFGELPPDERGRRVRSAAQALSAKLNLAKASKRRPIQPSLRRWLSRRAPAAETRPGGTVIFTRPECVKMRRSHLADPGWRRRPSDQAAAPFQVCSLRPWSGPTPIWTFRFCISAPDR